MSQRTQIARFHLDPVEVALLDRLLDDRAATRPTMATHTAADLAQADDPRAPASAGPYQPGAAGTR